MPTMKTFIIVNNNTQYTNSAVLLLLVVLIINTYVMETDTLIISSGLALFMKQRTTTEPPLEKQERPYTVQRLFKRVLKTYKAFTYKYGRNTVNLSEFTVEFVPTKVAAAQKTIVRFNEGTFMDLSRVDSIVRVRADVVDNATVVTDAFIACKDLMITYRYDDPEAHQMFIAGFVTCRVLSPTIRVRIEYSFAPPDYKVELLEAYFERLANVSYIIPVTEQYDNMQKEIGDTIFSHFMKNEVPHVETVLFQRFRMALLLADISRFMNDTVKP